MGISSLDSFDKIASSKQFTIGKTFQLKIMKIIFKKSHSNTVLTLQMSLSSQMKYIGYLLSKLSDAGIRFWFR